MNDLPTDLKTLADRIRWARERAGKSQSELARDIGVRPQSIQALESGRASSTRHTFEIARALDVPPVWLGTGLTEEAAHQQAAKAFQDARMPVVQLPALATMPRDVPVKGTAVGGAAGDFRFNGETIDYVRRPPGLERAQNVFAIFVAGTSMAPRFEEGEMVFVHPGRQPRPGDDVVVELKGKSDGEPGDCLIKRLVKRDNDQVVLEQFNPPRRDITVPTASVRTVFRILTTGEIVGA